MQEFTLQQLKLQILKILAHDSPRSMHKFNLLGRRFQKGGLEGILGIEFNEEQRALAVQAFDQLKGAGLIRPTYSDLVEPENWVVITDSGRQFLERGALDDLDVVLSKINPHLLDIRRGAWAALAANQPDSLRQAAHSGRELIDQVLKERAPDSAVKAESGFTLDPTSRSGVTRRMRLKLLMRLYKGSVSDTELSAAEKACDLVLAINDKLTASAHSRNALSSEDVRDAITAAEIALRQILLPR